MGTLPRPQQRSKKHDKDIGPGSKGFILATREMLKRRLTPPTVGGLYENREDIIQEVKAMLREKKLKKKKVRKPVKRKVYEKPMSHKGSTIDKKGVNK